MSGDATHASSILKLFGGLFQALKTSKALLKYGSVTMSVCFVSVLVKKKEQEKKNPEYAGTADGTIPEFLWIYLRYPLGGGGIERALKWETNMLPLV